MYKIIAVDLSDPHTNTLPGRNVEPRDITLQLRTSDGGVARMVLREETEAMKKESASA
jgi:hypothetical protein